MPDEKPKQGDSERVTEPKRETERRKDFSERAGVELRPIQPAPEVPPPPTPGTPEKKEGK